MVTKHKCGLPVSGSYLKMVSDEDGFIIAILAVLKWKQTEVEKNFAENSFDSFY